MEFSPESLFHVKKENEKKKKNPKFLVLEFGSSYTHTHTRTLSYRADWAVLLKLCYLCWSLF